ncbi:hypothetical protein ES288_A07G180100v1 [Gossypium darwinii]|uniref:Uncharacterized protein n=1 Tax=Gossypium darwinii TaxID=34276 RepID=A0A5D2FWU2_GOSDA|nr:hypothetical protein ES288_A07G180100v1 [Gossypium darwinii]
MFHNFSWVRSVDYRVLREIDCCWLIFLERYYDRRKLKVGLSTRSCVTQDRVIGCVLNRVCVTWLGLFGLCRPHGHV